MHTNSIGQNPEKASIIVHALKWRMTKGMWRAQNLPGPFCFSSPRKQKPLCLGKGQQKLHSDNTGVGSMLLEKENRKISSTTREAVGISAGPSTRDEERGRSHGSQNSELQAHTACLRLWLNQNHLKHPGSKYQVKSYSIYFWECFLFFIDNPHRNIIQKKDLKLIME